MQAGPKLGQLLISPDWRCRHAALICLAQIAEGCAKVLGGQLKGLVDMCDKVSLVVSTCCVPTAVVLDIACWCSTLQGSTVSLLAWLLTLDGLARMLAGR